MKQTILISLLSIASLSVFAQGTDKQCKRLPDMPATAAPTWPSSPYISKVDPHCAPCYTYTRKSGLEVMECPGLWFPPEDANKETIDAWQQSAIVNYPTNEQIAAVEVRAAKSYTGNYPVCKRDPNMPKNAKLVYPKSAYAPTQNANCAPCYEYTRKSGLKVMECPYALFPAEK